MDGDEKAREAVAALARWERGRLERGRPGASTATGPTVTPSLYQLPDGTWVRPGTIGYVRAFDDYKIDGVPVPYLLVELTNGPYLGHRFDTYEAACEARDRIARDVNATSIFPPEVEQGKWPDLSSSAKNVMTDLVDG